MTISEKSAYIKGLADGLDYDKESAEGKLITALIDIVGEMAGAIDEIDSSMDEIDSDLGDVEEYLFGEEDDDDYYDDDEECDGNCCDCGEDCGDDDFRMMFCPHCNEEIYFDESIEPSELTCPACGKKVCDGEDGEE